MQLRRSAADETADSTGVTVDGRCVRHQFEESEGLCRHCGDSFCSECLVYSFGPKKPPFCVSCALAAAGVRSNAGGAHPKISRREMKRREKAAAKAMKASKRRKADAEPEAEPEPAMISDWSADSLTFESDQAAS